MVIHDFCFGLRDALTDTNSGYLTGSTTSSYRADNTLESVGINSFSTDARISLNCPSSTSVWARGGFYMSSFYMYPMIQLMSGATPLLRAIPTAQSSSTTLKIEAWNGTSWDLLATSSSNIPSSTKTIIAAEVNIDDAAGIFRIYLNGVLFVEYTGDTLRAGASQITEVWYLRCASTTYWSAMFLTDLDSRTMDYEQKVPSGAGLLQEMTGTYADIDEYGSVNDNDKLISSSTDQSSTFIKSALNASVASGKTVVAVGVGSRAKKSLGGTINNIQMLIEDASGTVANSANSPLAESHEPKRALFHTNAAGGAWTFALADAVKFGVRSKA